jgi:hypothetical protein
VIFIAHAFQSRFTAHLFDNNSIIALSNKKEEKLQKRENFAILMYVHINE